MKSLCSKMLNKGLTALIALVLAVSVIPITGVSYEKVIIIGRGAK